MPASDASHLLIPYAASHSPASRQALGSLQLPHLARLLARLSLSAQDREPDHLVPPFSMPHERALARALGLAAPDGHTPWAAWSVLQAGWDQGPPTAWAYITPCHWQVGMDSVTLDHPDALQLTDAQSRALVDAMAPYFAEDGISLRYDTPGRWLACGEVFRDLPTASLDRVIGQNVKPWLPGASPAGKLLRRLQSEMQMLLYTHPVNDERAAQRQVVVNSFWVSGAGALAPGWAAPAPQPTIATGLREAALREDWPTWRQAWHTLDATACAQLLSTLAQTGAATLTLCSEHSALTYQAAPPSISARLSRWFKRPTPIAILETL